jgi:flagellar hook protein FlgE
MASNDSTNTAVPVTFDPPNVTFGSDGSITSPTDGLITVEISDSTGPQDITVDLSKMSQFSDGDKLTVDNITQDGYIAGDLNTTYFNGNGVLIGSYTNGQVKNLFKLPVATFPSDNLLDAVNGNAFVESQLSGTPTLNSLGSPNGTTQFVPGALETSNVDLGDQFSKMIVTQRAYSSASKVITTVDEMTQAVRDLKT